MKLRGLVLVFVCLLTLASTGCVSSRLAERQPSIAKTTPATEADFVAALNGNEAVLERRLGLSGDVDLSELRFVNRREAGTRSLDATRLVEGADIFGSLVDAKGSPPEAWVADIYSADQYLGSIRLREQGGTWILASSEYDRRVPILIETLGGEPNVVAEFGPYVRFLAGSREGSEVAISATPDSLMHAPPSIDVEPFRAYTADELRELYRNAAR